MTLGELLDERSAPVAAVLRECRAVREDVVQPTPAELHQWTGMGLVRERMIEHENSLHAVLVPGPRFAAYSGHRATAPVGAHVLSQALLGEVLTARLYGELSLDNLATTARSPLVKVHAARHLGMLKLEDDRQLHAVWLRCPTPKTVTSILDDTGGIPLTLYVPHRAHDRQALETHPRRHEFALIPYTMHAWPPE